MHSKKTIMALPYLMALAGSGNLFSRTKQKKEPQQRVKTKYDYERIEAAKQKRAKRAANRLALMNR